jgi:hypothetical protein
MTFTDYLQCFDDILSKKISDAPYDTTEYYEYTKLNQARMNRWMKTGNLLQTCISKLESIQQEQKWILITEPWCGDAAHIVPFIQKMCAVNNHLHLDLQLRDRHSDIDRYLTNGSKSIPIIVVRDRDGNDLFSWGPRPRACQSLFLTLKQKGNSNEIIKPALQEWFNADKGKSLQEEIIHHLESIPFE